MNILQLLTIGISIKFPSGLGFIYSLLFLATIGGVFFTYSGFWFGHFNMFETLGKLLFVGPLSFLFGYLALKAKSNARLAEHEKVKQE